MSELERLLVRVDATTEGLRRELDKAAGKVNTTNKKIEQSNTRLEKSFANVAARAKGFALAAGTGLAATYLKSIIQGGDEVNKLSVRLGASTEALSEYRYVAQQSGIAFNQFTMGLQRSTRRIAEAAQGTGEAKSALKELGLSASELAQMRPEQQLEMIADAMLGVANQSDRVRLAMKLFDSEGVSMLQMFEQGASGMRALRAEAQELGLTLDKETADAMTRATDEAHKFTKSIEGQATALAGSLAPALAEGLSLLNSYIEAAGGVGPALATLLPGIGPALSGMAAVKMQEAQREKKEMDEYIAKAKELGFVTQANELTVRESIEAQIEQNKAFLGNAETAGVAKERIAELQQQLDLMNKPVPDSAANTRAEKMTEYSTALEKTVANLKLLNAANDNSAESYERLKREIDAENEAIEKGYKLGTREFEQKKALIIQREKLTGRIEETAEARDKEAQRAQQQQEELSRALMAPWENAFENVQDELAQMLVDGEFSFDSLASIAKKLAAEVAAAWVIQPILGEVLGVTGFGGSGGGSGGGISSGGTGSFGGVGIGDLSSLSSVFSSGSLSQSIFALDSSIGTLIDTMGYDLFGVGTTGLPTLSGSGVAGGLSQSFTPGAGLAGLGGTMLADFAGLSGEYSSITGTIGTVIGTAVGGPIGAAIGGFLGSAVGGLFGGGGRPHPAATAGIDGFNSDGSFQGLDLQAKHLDEEAAQQIADALNAVTSTIAQTAGLDLSLIKAPTDDEGNIAGTAFQAGVNDGTGFFTFGDHKSDLNNKNVSVTFDPEDNDDLNRALGELSKLFVRRVEELGGEVNATLSNALDKIEVEGRAVEEVLSDIAFAAGFEELGEIPDVFTAMEVAAKALKAEFDAAAATAERLELSVEKVREVEEARMSALLSEYSRGIARGILSGVAPDRLAELDEEARYNIQLRDLMALGATKKEIDQAELLHTLNMQTIRAQNNEIENNLLVTERTRLQVATSLANRFGSVATSLRGLLDELDYGRFTAETPVNNLDNMRGIIRELGQQAALGDIDASEKLKEILPAFLELSGEVNQFNSDYAADRQLAKSVAQETLSTADRQTVLQERIASAAETQIDVLSSGFSALETAMTTLGISLEDIVNSASYGSGALTGLTQDQKNYTLIAREMGLLGANETATDGLLAQRINESGRLDEFKGQLNARGFANGGFVSGEAGIDRINARLSDGEFVTRSASVKKIGASKLEYMNRTGRIPANDDFSGQVDRLIEAVDAVGRTVAQSGNLTVQQQDEMIGRLDRIAKDGRVMRYAK